MTANQNAVLAGVGAGGAGGVELAWFAPLGTTAPTDTTTALAAAFKSAGFVDENGLAKGVNESSTDIKAYGTGSPVRTLQTESKITFDVNFLESNPISIAVYNRLPLDAIVPTVGTGAFDFTEGAFRTQKYAVVFDIVDGDNHIRAYCPDVEASARKGFDAKAGNAIPYGVTLTAYVGSDGVAVHWFYLVDALA